MAALTAVLLPGLDGTGDLFAPFVEAAPIGTRTIVVNDLFVNRFSICGVSAII
jgi:hypothetical protein